MTDPFRIALFLDVDGTLIEYAPTPDSVVVSEVLRLRLNELCQALEGALALISGRTIANLDQLFAPLRLISVGLHGIERRMASDAPILAEPVPEFPQQSLRALLSVAEPHAFLEHKGHCLAFHHRLPGSDAERLWKALAHVVSAAGPEWTLIRGRQVFEVKPAAITKAYGLQALLDRMPFQGRRAVVLGDDTTDLDMFEAAREVGGITIAVGSRIAQDGDLHLSSPRHVLRFFDRLLPLASQPMMRSALEDCVRQAMMTAGP